ncbi:Gpr1 family protein [Mycena kentingensis (nom. inval.)]|nr:Gpr1 family protein [Mycena kentingensis (nom. inval.)]
MLIPRTDCTLVLADMASAIPTLRDLTPRRRLQRRAVPSLKLPRAWPRALPTPRLDNLKYFAAPSSAALHLIGKSPNQKVPDDLLRAPRQRPISSPPLFEIWWTETGGFAAAESDIAPRMRTLILHERRTNSGAQNPSRAAAFLGILTRFAAPSDYDHEVDNRTPHNIIMIVNETLSKKREQLGFRSGFHDDISSLTMIRPGRKNDVSVVNRAGLPYLSLQPSPHAPTIRLLPLTSKTPSVEIMADIEANGTRTVGPTTTHPATFGSRTAAGRGYHPIGNPSGLGMLAFATTLFVLSLYSLNARHVNSVDGVLGLSLFTGGLATFMAGMWHFPRGNGYGGAVFTLYGSFWMSFGLFLIPGTGIMASYTETQFRSALGIYFMAWMMLTVLLIRMRRYTQSVDAPWPRPIRPNGNPNGAVSPTSNFERP